MARSKRESMDEVPELDLLAFMNMVVILIPMLLLSVVFIQVGVINITAPQLSVGPPSDTPPKPDDEEPLNLTVAVNAKGFRIAAKSAQLPEMEGCPKPGPTICLAKQEVDVAAKFQAARAAFAKGNPEAGQKALGEGVAAYNFVELYNTLVKVKKQYPEETIVNLTADAGIPYVVLVQVMDAVRYVRAEDSYDDSASFFAAEAKVKGNAPVDLFSDPVLSVVQ
jgi:biopolymer transport protein ExbD